MRKAFICPTKYVQGEDEILNLGYFVKTFGKRALLIAHKDDVARVKAKLDATAAQYKVEFVPANFGGECSRQEVKRLQELAKANTGYIKTMWCGDLACEMKMKEEAGLSSRCMPFEQEQLSDVCPCCGKPASKMVYWGVAY